MKKIKENIFFAQTRYFHFSHNIFYDVLVPMFAIQRRFLYPPKNSLLNFIYSSILNETTEE